MEPLRFTYTERACDACGGNATTPAWHHRTVAATTVGSVEFDITIVVCDCGHAFVSPAPEQGELDVYYQTSFENWSEPDFSIAKRLELIAGHASGGAFVELGANVRGPFAEAVRGRFDKYATLEPAASVASDYKSFDAIDGESADLVAHYFVLEHVRDVTGFLGSCRAVIKPDGVMICEVPDLALYPMEADALLLHEHMNHFTVSSLARTALRAGFELVDVSHRLCSRSFGFAAAFRPCEPRATAPIHDEPARRRAESSIRAGRAVGDEYAERLSETASVLRTMVENNETAVIWGANNVMLAILARLRHATISQLALVDSSPTKRHYGGYNVLEPRSALESLADAQALVICSDNAAKAILRSAEEASGRRFRDDQVMVMLPPRATQAK